MNLRLIKDRRAFTLTELAIVMLVIGTIMGAIWYAASNAKETQREGDAFNELQTVAQNINSMMAGQSFSGAFPLNMTSNMITAQTIPTSYVNNGTPTAADNPWSPTNFVVYAMTNKKFRLSFYSTSIQGCIALLLQATSCQAGQMGCPVQVWTEGATQSCLPGQNNCPGGPGSGTVIGWQSMSSTVASTMCGDNTPTANSVEFDYAL